MGRTSFEDLIKTQSWALIIESRNNELDLRISKMIRNPFLIFIHPLQNDMSKLNQKLNIKYVDMKYEIFSLIDNE